MAFLSYDPLKKHHIRTARQWTADTKRRCWRAGVSAGSCVDAAVLSPSWAVKTYGTGRQEHRSQLCRMLLMPIALQICRPGVQPRCRGRVLPSRLAGPRAGSDAARRPQQEHVRTRGAVHAAPRVRSRPRHAEAESRSLLWWVRSIPGSAPVALLGGGRGWRRIRRKG